MCVCVQSPIYSCTYYHIFYHRIPVHIHVHSVMYVYIYAVKAFHSVAGAGVGEGDTYQRVYVDDGSTAVGPLDYLVHQTAPLSLNLHLSGHCITEGIYIHTQCMYIHMHVHVLYIVHMYMSFHQCTVHCTCTWCHG